MMKSRLVSIVAIFILSTYADGVPPMSSSLDSSPDQTWLKRAQSNERRTDGSKNVHEIGSYLPLVYKTAICFEWPYVTGLRGVEEGQKYKYQVGQDQSLRSALDMLRETSAGVLVWDVVDGSICIRAPEGAADSENLLDQIVSLRLGGVSTWDALRELAVEINKQPMNGRQVSISPNVLSSGYGPPDAFHNDSSISLQLENVTGREALCAIIKVSPLEISYRYTNHGPRERYPNMKLRGAVNITFHEDGQRMRYRGQDRLPQLEFNRWMAEIKATLNSDPEDGVDP